MRASQNEGDLSYYAGNNQATVSSHSISRQN